MITIFIIGDSEKTLLLMYVMIIPLQEKSNFSNCAFGSRSKLQIVNNLTYLSRNSVIFEQRDFKKSPKDSIDNKIHEKSLSRASSFFQS